MKLLGLGLVAVLACGTIVDVRAASGFAGGPPDADTLFSRFDDNGDGALTEDEVFAPMWTRLQAADADGDGRVTRAEYDNAVES